LYPDFAFLNFPTQHRGRAQVLNFPRQHEGRAYLYNFTTIRIFVET